jgi:hypothetical protein
MSEEDERENDNHLKKLFNTAHYAAKHYKLFTDFENLYQLLNILTKNKMQNTAGRAKHYSTTLLH